MRALILQFEDDDPPGHLGARLSAHGVEWNVAALDAPHAPLSLDGYDMLVALGGAMNANQADRYPFLREAEALIRTAVRSGLPYLGICLGGQMLARAMGAAVTRAPVQEVGLIEVTLHAAAGTDPLLHGLGPILETTQFHEDTFAIPDGGVLLGSSANCRTQIVRCAERAYALQFHPEASWEAFAGWIESGYLSFVGPERAANGVALVNEVRGHDATIRAHAQTLFDNFVRLAAPAYSSI